MRWHDALAKRKRIDENNEGNMWLLRSLVFIAAMSMLVACADTPTISHQTLGDADTLATTADARLIYARHVDTNLGTGQIVPHEVICAEPSPDVAKAFSQAFSLTAEADAKALPALAAAGDVNASGALLHSHSEAISQLGKRLGTIQLLRNGLFSACEAYANGAISSMSYAFLLSRFGDVMVTLLAVELVAGDGTSVSQNASKTASVNAPASEPVGASAPAGASSPSGASAHEIAAAAAAAAGSAALAAEAGKPTQTGDTTGKTGTSQQAAPGQVKTDGTTTSPQTQSASLSDAQTTAIVNLQQAFLRGSEAAPLVLACSAALDRPDEAAQSTVDARNTRMSSRSQLVSICEDFLRNYSQMTVQALAAERIAEAQKITQLSPTSNVTKTTTTRPVVTTRPTTGKKKKLTGAITPPAAPLKNTTAP